MVQPLQILRGTQNTDKRVRGEINFTPYYLLEAARELSTTNPTGRHSPAKATLHREYRIYGAGGKRASSPGVSYAKIVTAFSVKVNPSASRYIPHPTATQVAAANIPGMDKHGAKHSPVIKKRASPNHPR